VTLTYLLTYIFCRSDCIGLYVLATHILSRALI